MTGGQEAGDGGGGRHARDAAIGLLLAAVVGGITPLIEKAGAKLPADPWIVVAAFGVCLVVVLFLTGASRVFKGFAILGVVLAVVCVVAADQLTKPSIELHMGVRRVTGIDPQKDHTAAVTAHPRDVLEMKVSLRGKRGFAKGTSVEVTLPRNPGNASAPGVAATEGFKRDAKDRLTIRTLNDELVRLSRPSRYRYRATAAFRSDEGWKSLRVAPPQETPKRFKLKLVPAGLAASDGVRELEFDFLVEVQPG